MLEYTFSLANFEILILILVRISCFVYIAPFFGTRNAPSQAKIAFSFFVALLVYGFVDKTAIEYTGMIGYAIIVLKEGITGLLIGFAANICNSIILFAGNIIDMDIGLSMVTEFDPTMNTQVTITGNLYNYFILLLLIATNMHHVILQAVVDSFTVIPINGQIFNWDSLAGSMTQYLRYSCKGCTTDEHVCGWYADENTDWSGRFIPDSFIAAGDCQFYIYRNEKNDGFIYRGNVLRWN